MCPGLFDLKEDLVSAQGSYNLVEVVIAIQT